MEQKGSMPTIEECKPVSGERWIFEIKSRSRPTQKPWRVDLEAYNWNGACDCEDFRFSREKDLTLGAKPGDDYRCYHILTARSYVMEEIFPKLAMALGGPRMPTPGEGTSAKTRAREAIKALRGDVANLMEMRQLITGQIEESYEEQTDSDSSPEPKRTPPKIYHLEDRRFER